MTREEDKIRWTTAQLEHQAWLALPEAHSRARTRAAWAAYLGVSSESLRVWEREPLFQAAVEELRERYRTERGPEWSAAQEAHLQWLGVPEAEREPPSRLAWAGVLGVARLTLDFWERLVEFEGERTRREIERNRQSPWSAAQRRHQRWLATPPEQRPYPLRHEWAAQLGVHRQTLRRWELLDGFKEAVSEAVPLEPPRAYEWTEPQRQHLQWCATPRGKRTPRFKKAWAQELGVYPGTLRLWEKKKGFWEEVARLEAAQEQPPSSPWSPKQQQHQQWLATPPPSRYPRFKHEWADLLGVHINTLVYWEQEPGFRERVSDIVGQLMGEALPEVLHTLAQTAKQPGQVAAQRLCLEVLGMVSRRSVKPRPSRSKGRSA